MEKLILSSFTFWGYTLSLISGVLLHLQPISFGLAAFPGSVPTWGKCFHIRLQSPVQQNSVSRGPMPVELISKMEEVSWNRKDDTVISVLKVL